MPLSGSTGRVPRLRAGDGERAGLRVPVQRTAHAGRGAAGGQAALLRQLDEGEAAAVLLVEAEHDAGAVALAVDIEAVVADDVARRHAAGRLAVDREQAEERVEVGQRRAAAELQAAAVEADAHLRVVQAGGGQDRHPRRRRLAVGAVDRDVGEIHLAGRAVAAGRVDDPTGAQRHVAELRAIGVVVGTRHDAERAGVHEEACLLGAAALVERQRHVARVVDVRRRRVDRRVRALQRERHVEALAVAIEVPLSLRRDAGQSEHGRPCETREVSRRVFEHAFHSPKERGAWARSRLFPRCARSLIKLHRECY